MIYVSHQVKPCETVLRQRRLQLLPSALFLRSFFGDNGPKLYALLLPTVQSSTLSITHTSRRSPFGDFASGTCLRRGSKLALATWSPPSCKSLLDHTQFFFPNTVPDMNHSNREH
ncbi:hypothetical protein K443DRAFT_439608 [Laccaria amethystina LaAM-08-1]|uniref:Uncharacterized protein n=1 Tax=Laccaria amethystina LaAM-08-1 TaxID=1095629 RepID=A0A0C9X3R4_9AGAR|nr:hypothetical protein K443DRAFT_439608 [Laccaria amethystina LaAM-08-1]